MTLAMTPGARRDLVLGGSVIAVGIALLAFALFGDDEGFRAPRWVVATVALCFVASGVIPLRVAASSGGFTLNGTYANAAVSGALAACVLACVWMMVAVGPEGIALDIPITLPLEVERAVRTVVFYGVLGVVTAACLAGCLYTFGRALPALGHTTLVAIAAPLLGAVIWVGIQLHQDRATPVSGPALFLSFDRRFPGDEYLTRVQGDEIIARPGVSGSGLWVGGSGDWLDVEIPRGFDTRSGLTLELWIKRENWVNPYLKGRNLQTVATVELEREYRGRPEIQSVSLSMEILGSRPGAGGGLGQTDALRYRPVARVGEVRVAPPGSATLIPGNRWTHLAIVYDRFLVDRMRLYVDGHLAARAMSWSDAPGFADLRTLRLGTGAERYGAYRGMIDEVKIYNRALADDEIAAETAGTKSGE